MKAILEKINFSGKWKITGTPEQIAEAEQKTKLLLQGIWDATRLSDWNPDTGKIDPKLNQQLAKIFAKASK